MSVLGWYIPEAFKGFQLKQDIFVVVDHLIEHYEYSPREIGKGVVLRLEKVIGGINKGTVPVDQIIIEKDVSGKLCVDKRDYQLFVDLDRLLRTNVSEHLVCCGEY